MIQIRIDAYLVPLEHPEDSVVLGLIDFASMHGNHSGHGDHLLMMMQISIGRPGHPVLLKVVKGHWAPSRQDPGRAARRSTSSRGSGP